jgi:hypothetical protein
VPGETPSTAGEDARAPQNPDAGTATVFMKLLQAVLFLAKKQGRLAGKRGYPLKYLTLFFAFFRFIGIF